MFRRVLDLFRLYARHHRRLIVTGFSFGAYSDPKTKRLDTARLTGHVDRVVMNGDRLTFSGWTTAEKITLVSAMGNASMRPNILRTDVAEVHGISPRVGFELTQPYGNSRFTIVAEVGTQKVEHHCAPISRLRLKRNSVGLFLRFLRDLARAAPHALKARSGDAIARSKVKQILGLETRLEAAPMETMLFEDPRWPVEWPDPQPVTIVVPVYNAFSLLPEVLGRVVRNTDLPWHLVVIEDCSSDAQVRPWLTDWVARQEAETPGRITLLQNEENRGFIASVNRGFAEAIKRGHHVLLLNSDAFVPEKWASRMLRPILMHDNIATVTPMSNDAEIFSVPAICERTVIEPGQGDAMDALARTFNPEATLSVVPTGVGFCMAMNIDYLKKVTDFDTSFGRGYGEEVDWCQRIRGLGGKHLGLPGLFVEHRGGESFGSAEKLKLVEKNNKTISTRYPDYDMEVQTFIAADPLITSRVALAVAWAMSRPGEAEEETGFPIYIAHSLGGGAEKYLERRIEADLERGRPSVVIRVGGPARWLVEVVSKSGLVSGMTDDWTFVKRLLDPIARRHVVYSCAVGDPDPAVLPEDLVELKREGDSFEVLFHDFFPLTPSYTLLDEDGCYRGPVIELRDDAAHTVVRPNGDLIGLAGWRAAWGRMMAAATEIVVFSEDSYAQVAQVYPAHADKLVRRPHKMLAEVPRIDPPDTGIRTVGVLGNIGYQKGAAVVAELGRLVEPDASMDLVVVGNVDPAYTPPANVTVHGDYTLDELPDIVERYGITEWLIPSIWPETFSFTTHEALATGLPVYAFYIGAQGAAVARADNGRPIHFDADSPLASHVLNTLRGETGLVGEDDTPGAAAEDSLTAPGTRAGLVNAANAASASSAAGASGPGATTGGTTGATTGAGARKNEAS
ncbi:MAG: glycosyl transferase [Rhodobacteraceae bacterium]|nr:glycosyl transferase [Paracoccaceae bacterium]